MSDLRPVRLDTSIRDARAALREMDRGETLALRDLADIFRAGEADIFDSGGGAIGKTWKALKPATVKARMRLAKRFGLRIGGSRPILENFGDLRAALTIKGGAHHQVVGRGGVRLVVDQKSVNRHDRKKGLGMALTARGRRRKPRGKGARYPDNIVEIHDEGRGKAPKRPVVGVPAAREAEMERRVQKYLESVGKIMMGGSL